LTNGGAAGTLVITLTDTQLNLSPNQYFWKLRTTAPTDYLWFNGIFTVNGYTWEGGTDYNVSVALTVANNEINVSLVSAASSAAAWGAITGTLSAQTDLNTALAAKQALINAAVAITDAATITLTAIKHTLTTDEATITFSDSYTGDFLSVEITFNATGTTWTFPTGSKLTYVNEAGTATTSTTTMTISGATSGDKMVMSRGLFGSNYYYIVKNFG
jgi:hypothetical protein